MLFKNISFFTQVSIEYNNHLVQAGFEPHIHVAHESKEKDERVTCLYHIDPVRVEDTNSCFCVIL